MAFFGSLGALRGLAIAGGQAAKTIDAREKEREDKIYDGIKTWVKDTMPTSKEYGSKAIILRRKVSDSINQVVQKYLDGMDLTKEQKVAGARALLKDHGYKVENIDKAYQKASALNQIFYNMSTTENKGDYTPLSTSAFVNTRLANLGKLKTKETVDDNALFITRTQLGDFNASIDGVKQASKIYDGSNIFRTGFNESVFKNVQDSVLSSTADYRGAMPELAKVKRKQTITTLEAQKEVQAYALKEAQLKKYISDVENATGKNAIKWKATDWRNNYKLSLNDALNKTDFNFGEISFSQDGSILLPMGTGTNKTKYEAAKTKVLDNAFMNFVNGAIKANQYDSEAFKSVAFPLANNVSTTKFPKINATQPIGEEGTNLNFAKLLSGRVYEFGGYKAIWMQHSPKEKDPRKRGNFYRLPR